MTSIRDFLTDDHRRCDDVFADVEQAVADGNWAVGDTFGRFSAAVLQHLRSRNRCSSRLSRQKTGMTMGPTQVMRSEHVQMRELIAAAGAALAGRMPTNTPAMPKPC